MMESALQGVDTRESSKLAGAVNYALWSFKIEWIFRDELIWHLVDPSTGSMTRSASTESEVGDSAATNAATDRGKNKKDVSVAEDLLVLQRQKTRAMRIMIGTVKDSILPHIMRIKDPRQMWNKLRSLYESKSTNRRLALKSQLYNLRMTEKQSVEEHLRNISTLVAQLANIDAIIPDEDLIDRILMSLPDSWADFCGQVSTRETPITFIELEALLLQEDGRRSRFKNRSQVEEALIVEGGSNKSNRRGGKGVHGSSRIGNYRSSGTTVADNRRQSAATGGRPASSSGKVTSSGSFNANGRGSNRSHISNQGRSSNTSRNPPTQGVCHKCGGKDHWANKCEITNLEEKIREIRLANNYQGSSWKKSSQAHIAEAESHEDTVEDIEEYMEEEHEAYATEALSIPTASNWYLDSGASMHVTGNKSLLFDVRKGPNSQITTANGRSLPVNAQGAITLPGNKRLSEVLYVPGLCKNLLSVGRLADEGHFTLFGAKNCWVFAQDKPTKVLFTGSRSHSNSLYRLNTSLSGNANLSPPLSLNLATLTPPGLTELWHKRLGHLNFQTLYNFSRQGLVTGLPLLKKVHTTCEPCILGKQHTHAIPRHSFSQTSRPLELIHSDLCGPFPHTSLKRSRYLLTFIDDYTRRTWVYFLATKDETFKTFRQFQQLTEKQTSLKISCLRTDRGGEYLSTDFNSYCDEQGIHHHLTAAHTPQQNGIAERKNRHLCETMRTLLFGANLPTILWEEALRTSNYIGNRMPHRALHKITPFQRFTGNKPDVSHLKVFGCRAYIHIKSGTKLQPKSLISTFIGYDDQSKAYRCYDSNRSKIIISRDVVFNEDVLGIPSPFASNVEAYDELDHFLLLNGISESLTIGKANPPSFFGTDQSQPSSQSQLSPGLQSISTQDTNVSLSDSQSIRSIDNRPGLISTPTLTHTTTTSSGTSHPSPTTMCPPSTSTQSSSAPDCDSNHSLPSPTSTPLITDNQNFPISDHISEPDPSFDVSQYPPRRSTRFRKQSVKLDDYILSVTPENFDICLTDMDQEIMGDNLTYNEASRHKGWINAMRDEITSIHHNYTWDLVPLPPGKKTITAKWIYKTKPGLLGETPRLKARLVARGFQQRHGIDFDEVFAPVVKWSTIRTLTARAAKLGHKIHHLDVKTAFLYGTLDDEVYMEQPEGFVEPGQEHKVCRLRKALYGLKQSPRQWYKRINDFLLSQGFNRSDSDHNLYYKGVGDDQTLLLIYVDDLFLTGGDEEDIEWVIQQLSKEFALTNLGIAHKYLGVEFLHLPEGKFLHQTAYALQLLADYGMTDCRPNNVPLPAGIHLLSNMDSPPVDSTNYCQIVGKLIFLTTTRPDLAYSVGLVSRFMSKPQAAHLDAVHHILRYIKKTPKYGLFYASNDTKPVQGFTDADWAACHETRRSTGGYCFKLAGAAITWQSKRQPTVAKSSTESEYVSLSVGASEAAWLRRLLRELPSSSSSTPSSLPIHLTSSQIRMDLQATQPIQVHCDNQSAIKLAKNPVFHARTKHIEVHHHFVRERLLRGEIELHYISTDDQPADIFTKPLSRTKFEQHRTALGIICSTSLPSCHQM